MKYNFEIINTIQSLIALKEDWNLLYSKCASHPFVSFTWISGWAEWLKDEYSFFIVLVRDEENNLVGIAPLGIFIKKRCGLSIRTLTFFTDRPSDYQDFLVLDGQPLIISIIIEAIYEYRALWDVVELANFPFDSPNLDSIQNNKILKFRERMCAYCPRVEFSHKDLDFDAIIAKKTRQDVVYQIRRLEKTSPLELHKVSTEAEIADYLNSFCQLHQKRWNDTSTKSLFNDELFKRFFIEMGTNMFINGKASCSYLTYQGKMVAGHYGFRSKNSFFYYYPAYDPDYARNSIGKVFLYLLVKSEADADLRVFDFLRGNEEYKKNWGTVTYSNVQLTAVKSNVKGWMILWDWFYNKNRKHFVFRVYRKIVKSVAK